MEDQHSSIEQIITAVDKAFCVRLYIPEILQSVTTDSPSCVQIFIGMIKRVFWIMRNIYCSILKCIYSILTCNDYDHHHDHRCTTTTTTTTTTIAPPTTVPPTDPNNVTQINLNHVQYVQILNKKSGIFIITIYKNNGPCATFNVAKSGPTTKAVINHILRVDTMSCALNIEWNNNDTVRAKINSIDSSCDGLYTINWM